MMPERARIYRLGLLAGLALGVGFAVWRVARGEGTRSAFLWGGGGLLVGLAIALLSDVGIQLQRRDLPNPGAGEPTVLPRDLEKKE